MSVETGITLQLVGVLTLLGIGAWFWALRQVRAWYGRTTHPAATGAPNAPAARIDAATVSGAGTALRRPPEDLAVTVQALQRAAPDHRYRIPLGWNVADGVADVNWAALVSDVNHVLLTAQSDGGKDNWAIGALLSLALLHRPEQVQFAIIDGKGTGLCGLGG